jgi:hypothetical protein
MLGISLARTLTDRTHIALAPEQSASEYADRTYDYMAFQHASLGNPNDCDSRAGSHLSSFRGRSILHMTSPCNNLGASGLQTRLFWPPKACRRCTMLSNTVHCVRLSRSRLCLHGTCIFAGKPIPGRALAFAGAAREIRWGIAGLSRFDVGSLLHMNAHDTLLAGLCATNKVCSPGLIGA